MILAILLDGVILSGAAFQAERRISLMRDGVERAFLLCPQDSDSPLLRTRLRCLYHDFHQRDFPSLD
jgi:hypothetical protein